MCLAGESQRGPIEPELGAWQPKPEPVARCQTMSLGRLNPWKGKVYVQQGVMHSRAGGPNRGNDPVPDNESRRPDKGNVPLFFPDLKTEKVLESQVICNPKIAKRVYMAFRENASEVEPWVAVLAIE